MNANVGICIITFKRPHQLLKTLSQIKERTLYPNYNIYIIIDFESDNLTLNALQESGLIEKLSIKKVEMFPSPAECVKTTNRCYSIGEEPHFAWLSDDMEVERGWLQEAMKCMETFLSKQGLVVFKDGIQNGKNACAGLISRDFIKKELGGIFFNEIYIHYGADLELFRKCRLINKVKYCPSSVVWHNHWAHRTKSGRKVERDFIYEQSMKWRKRDDDILKERTKEGFK